jgi:hypothetical protein
MVSTKPEVVITSLLIAISTNSAICLRLRPVEWAYNNYVHDFHISCVFYLVVWMLALLAYFTLNYLLRYFMISFHTYKLPDLLAYLLTYLLISYLLPVFIVSLHTSWHPDFKTYSLSYFLISQFTYFTTSWFYALLHTRLQDFNYDFPYDFVTSITTLLMT